MEQLSIRAGIRVITHNMYDITDTEDMCPTIKTIT